jgi:hypothetical protein
MPEMGGSAVLDMDFASGQYGHRPLYFWFAVEPAVRESLTR